MPPAGNGPVIPGYQFPGELGQGGMGVVYRAVRSSDGVEVAIKTLLPAIKPRPGMVERFLREARIV